MKKVHIIAGGTITHIRPHLALCAPAYGGTGRRLLDICQQYSDKLQVQCHLTAMAGGSKCLESVKDVARELDAIKHDLDTKIVFLPVAICDFEGIVGERDIGSGLWVYPPESDRFGPRLSTHNLDKKQPETWPHLRLRPLGKLISHLRNGRKDIFAVGFKHTDGATEQEQYIVERWFLQLGFCK